MAIRNPSDLGPNLVPQAQDGQPRKSHEKCSASNHLGSAMLAFFGVDLYGRDSNSGSQWDGSCCPGTLPFSGTTWGKLLRQMVAQVWMVKRRRCCAQLAVGIERRQVGHPAAPA